MIVPKCPSDCKAMNEHFEATMKVSNEWKSVRKEVVEESRHLQASAAKFSIIFSKQPDKLFERGSVGLLWSTSGNFFLQSSKY